MLAETVSDPEASKKLIEMAEEFRLYAERLEETQQVFPDDAGRSLKLPFTKRSVNVPPLTQPLYRTLVGAWQDWPGGSSHGHLSRLG
jgi:hypothetical protein